MLAGQPSLVLPMLEAMVTRRRPNLNVSQTLAHKLHHCLSVACILSCCSCPLIPPRARGSWGNSLLPTHSCCSIWWHLPQFIEFVHCVINTSWWWFLSPLKLGSFALHGMMNLSPLLNVIMKCSPSTPIIAACIAVLICLKVTLDDPALSSRNCKWIPSPCAHNLDCWLACTVSGSHQLICFLDASILLMARGGSFQQWWMSRSRWLQTVS